MALIISLKFDYEKLESIAYIEVIEFDELFSWKLIRILCESKQMSHRQ